LGGQVKMSHNDIINLVSIQKLERLMNKEIKNMADHATHLKQLVCIGHKKN